MNPTSLFNWMLLSTVLLGAWWLCYHLALRQERSFAYNRAFLVLGPVLATTVPLLPLSWPTSWGPVPETLPGMATVLLPAVQVGAAGAQAGAAWPGWIVPVYLAGALLLVLRLGYGLGQLWLRARRLPREPHPGYTLLRTGGRLPTSSFGRVVLWDDTLPLSAAEAQQVLAHELAHLRLGHTYDRLLLELLRVVLWFNPFAHLCSRALGLAHEYQADAATLAAAPIDGPRTAASYTQLLARQVAGRLGFSLPLAHSFSESQTLNRIAMIHKTAPVRRWKQWLALPLLGLLFVTVACERNADFLPPPPPPSRVEVSELAPAPPPAPEAEQAPPPPPVLVDEMPAPPPPPTVYNSVDQMPELPGGGGNQAIVQYIQSHTKYTDALGEGPQEGLVLARFTVLETGEVGNVTIVKGLLRGYNHAVVNAIRTLPRFIPGKKDNKAVPVSFTVPVRFAMKTPLKGASLRLFNEYGMWAPKPVVAGC